MNPRLEDLRKRLLPSFEPAGSSDAIFARSSQSAAIDRSKQPGTSGAEAAAGDLAEVTDFLPAHAGRGEDNALGQAITPLHLHFGATDVEHLDLNLVFWAAIVRVEDADAVGHHQSALERGAASGKNGEEISCGHLDDEARRDERDLPGCQPHIL